MTKITYSLQDFRQSILYMAAKAGSTYTCGEITFDNNGNIKFGARLVTDQCYSGIGNTPQEALDLLAIKLFPPSVVKQDVDVLAEVLDNTTQS